jgi:hypothetical protein
MCKCRYSVLCVHNNLILYMCFHKQATHRLDMELDLQNLFGLHVYSCTQWLRPRNLTPPSHRIRAHRRGRYWSAKIDDISFVTP